MLLNKGNILLLRDPTSFNNGDLYESAFTAAKTPHAFLDSRARDGPHQYHAARISNGARRANGTGNDEFPSYVIGKLANFVLAVQARPTKLLYLTGDKNNYDTLPIILDGAGVSSHSLKVYRFQGSFTSRKGDRKGETEWIMFFATSAAEPAP
ncbi:hypothetical protein EDD85DRAFT_955884 [Armillaria nabsnona]|nr:hypothetical protein EDD85DRAFT_955884 [Armillaria nabsnona]